MIRMRTAALIVATAVVGPMAGGQDTPALPASPRLAELVKQLKDPDWDTRMEAATALGMLGPAAKGAIPNLVEALKDPVAPVRMKALDALMFMGTAAAAAAPQIPPFLNDADELVRISAVIALTRVTPDRASIVPLLKNALGDKASRVRRQAATELIQMRAEVPAAIPVVREGLKAEFPLHRIEAIKTLGEVVSPEERKSLAATAGEYLKAPDRDLRLQTVRALAYLGAEGVPYLVGVLKAEEQDRRVQIAAIMALGRMGPDAQAAVPVLQGFAERKGIWMKASQRSIAAIEGKEPRLPPEVTGPVPPLPNEAVRPSPPSHDPEPYAIAALRFACVPVRVPSTGC